MPLVEAVKRKGVKVPVWTACRIDAEMGEKYLRKGSLDFVGMTRFLLADPEYPNKIREGRLEDVRPCLGCLHCFEMRNRNKKLECRVNGTLGREIMPEYQAKPAERRKKVLVVGGGPSGMEAARIAAERGHEVVLYEKDPRLGGLVPLAAIVKDCETPELLDFVHYEERELRKSKVTVHKGTAVTPDIVRTEKPDAIVVAAGAVHPEFDLPGHGREQRHPHRQALRHAQLLPQDLQLGADCRSSPTCGCRSASGWSSWAAPCTAASWASSWSSGTAG